jgi:hypothetical protein
MEASIFSGVVKRRKTREGCAVATDEELGEIPLDPSAEHAGQRLFQITETAGPPLTSTFATSGSSRRS